MQRTVTPDLPKELARRIVLNLTCRDVCNAAKASKAFWQQWGNALSAIEAATINRNQQLASLVQFQTRRAPMGLKVH